MSTLPMGPSGVVSIALCKKERGVEAMGSSCAHRCAQRLFAARATAPVDRASFIGSRSPHMTWHFVSKKQQHALGWRWIPLLPKRIPSV